MSLEILNEPNAHCTFLKQFTYRFAWRPEKHYVAGTQIEVRSHCLRAFISWRYAAFRMEAGDIAFRWKIRPTVSDYRQNMGRVLFRARLPYGAPKDQPVEFEMTVIPPIWAGIDNRLSVWTIDVSNNFAADAPTPDPIQEEGSTCVLAVEAGPVENLSIHSRPVPGPDGTVRTAVVPEDRFGNPSRFAEPVDCQLEWNGDSQNLALSGAELLHLDAPTDTQRARIAVPLSALSARENIANGRIEGDCAIVIGNPVWPDGPDDLRAAFGEFHWHTDFSGDGQRPIAEAIRCARDYLNMDFVAPGDHSPKGEKWVETVRALEDANSPDEFATFFGWECSSDRGHENYYFTDPDHPLVSGGPAGIAGGRPDNLREKLDQLSRTRDFLVIPHHTNSVAETRRQEDDSPFWHPYPWAEPADDYLRLVEIMQIRGNQEREEYDDAWRGWHQNNHSSVQTALALGHKLGFVGGTDNHCGWPGRAFAECEGLGIHPSRSVILTGVWTPRLERQNVYDSLKARHTWAVWDTRALVWFAVNGTQAGSEIAIPRGTELTAHLRLSAEDALQTVEIISAGRVVWQQSFVEPDVEIEISLGTAEQSTHFYLRALQRNGGIIYASPVFVAVS